MRKTNVIQRIARRRQLNHLQRRIHAVRRAELGKDASTSTSTISITVTVTAAAAAGGRQAEGAGAGLVEDGHEAGVELVDGAAEGDVDVGEGPVVGDGHGDGAAGEGPCRPLLGWDCLVDICACCRREDVNLCMRDIDGVEGGGDDLAVFFFRS